jgi:hypothetical protein
VQASLLEVGFEGRESHWQLAYFERMVSLHPDRLNRAPLWYSGVGLLAARGPVRPSPGVGRIERRTGTNVNSARLELCLRGCDRASGAHPRKEG